MFGLSNAVCTMCFGALLCAGGCCSFERAKRCISRSCEAKHGFRAP